MPTAQLEPALDHISKNKDRFLQDFRTLLKQPSVSAQKLGIEDCAKIVKKQMDMAGLKAKILPVKNGNPVVYGEAPSKSSSKTLLIYGHYDVQPVEPLEKWLWGPFKAKEYPHSYNGPIDENTAWRLFWAMNTIKGQDENILIKGWYDDVVPFSPIQSRLMNKIQFDGNGLLRDWGLKSFPRAKNNREAFKHYMTEPTCTICGFKAGYIGEGSKTVLPGSAMLKIDFRIVNDQNPRKLLQLLKEHLHSHGFDDIQVKALGLVEPSTTKPSAPIAKAAERAGRMVYGRAPVVMPRNPASGPDYLFTKHLGLDSIWTGSGPPSAYSHAHAPNEWTTIDYFVNGIKYIATIMDCYAH